MNFLLTNKKNIDNITSQYSLNETINNQIIDIQHRIDCMVRGNMKKDPKKPPWVEKQKVIFKWGLAQFVVWLQKKYREEEHKKINPNIVTLRRDYKHDTKGWITDSIGIKNPEDWEEIKKAIDVDFAEDLNWLTKKEALTKLKEEPSEKIVDEVIEKRPSITLDFLDRTKVSEMDIDLMENFAKKLFRKNEEVMKKYLNLFNELLKIEKKDEKYLENLNDVVRKISIYGISSTMNHIVYRLGKITIFEKMILDEATYERKGKDSIHELLEKDIWLLGEEYQILQSDKPLKKLIGDYFIKKYKKYGRLRPDFACSTFEKKLIIIEIKRPKYKMTMDDINKIELYRNIAERFSPDDLDDPECYLIVSSIPSDLRKTVKSRKNEKIYVNTYKEIIKDVRIRYQRLLEILEEEVEKISDKS